jgi:molybdopterin-guanine dinucleotide biosynthesis protein A
MAIVVRHGARAVAASADDRHGEGLSDVAQSISILRPAGQFPPTLGMIVAAALPSGSVATQPALLRIGGETVLDRVRNRFGPHCAGLLVVTDDDPVLFAACGLPVVALTPPAGPFEGLRAGLGWMARHMPALEWAASVPAAAPFLPDDLLGRLHAAREATGAALVFASVGGRPVPDAALVRACARDPAAIAAGARYVEWPATPFDPFLRVCSLEDITRAESIAARLARV